MTYRVIDLQTQRTIRSYHTRAQALRFQDLMDASYGAVRYSVHASEPAQRYAEMQRTLDSAKGMVSTEVSL